MGSNKKTTIFSALLLGLVLVFGFFLFSGSRKDPQKEFVDKLHKRSVRVQRTQAQKWVEANQWSELESHLKSAHSEKKRIHFLKELQFVIDNRDPEMNAQQKQALRNILFDFVDSQASEKSLRKKAKALVLAGRNLGKISPSDLDLDRKTKVVNWMESKNETIVDIAFFVLTSVRPAPQAFVKKIEEFLISGHPIKIRNAVATVETMIDFKSRKEIIAGLEGRFFKLPEKSQPMVYKFLIKNESLLTDPDSLISYCIKQNGFEWQEAFLFTMETSQQKMKYWGDFERRQKDYNHELLKARAQRLVASLNKEGKKK